MGVAAYNRASHVIRQKIAAEDRPSEFDFIDRLNSIEKYDDAGSPTEPLTFTHSRGVWWVEADSCGSSGYGYWYKSLYEAVRRWRVEIVEYREPGVWIGIPI